MFGRTSWRGREVLCTNPAALAGGSAELDSIFPAELFSELFAPSRPVSTTWVDAPGAYRAQCVRRGGANVLKVAPVDGAPDLQPSPDASWGLHTLDVSLALGDLVDLVGSEASAYARMNPTSR